MQLQKTTLVKNREIKRIWHEIDASELPLGRLASKVARLLNGKHKTTYAPHQDLGDFVVVKNAKNLKISVRAKKVEQKKYHTYSGYPGGLRTQTLAEKLAKNPGEVIRHAVRGMIDDNRLRKNKLRRL